MLVFFLHFLLVFVCRNDVVVIHFFHRLVSSARLFMIKLSWGYNVLVFIPSGKPAALQGFGDFGLPVGSGTKFEVGRTTSCEEGNDAAMNVPMDLESNMGQFCVCVKRDLSRLKFLLYFRSSWGPCSIIWRWRPFH